MNTVQAMLSLIPFFEISFLRVLILKMFCF